MITYSAGLRSVESILIHVDGGCMPKNPGGITTSGWVLYDLSKPEKPFAEQFKVVCTGGDLATNNFGEYSALELALDFLIEDKWRGNLTVRADSKLLIEQVSGRWKCNFEHLRNKRDIIRKQIDSLQLQIITHDNPIAEEGKYACHLEWIPRNKNEYADALCHKAYQEFIKK